MPMRTNIQATTDPKEKAMPRVTVREAAEITLPREAAEKLGVVEGGELDVELVEGGVLLKPVTDREKAWRKVLEIVEEDKWIGPEPRPSPEEEEEQIYEIVRTFRERHG